MKGSTKETLLFIAIVVMFVAFVTWSFVRGREDNRQDVDEIEYFYCDEVLVNHLTEDCKFARGNRVYRSKDEVLYSDQLEHFCSRCISMRVADELYRLIDKAHSGIDWLYARCAIEGETKAGFVERCKDVESLEHIYGETDVLRKIFPTVKEFKSSSR